MKVVASSKFPLCDSKNCRPQCSWCAYKNANRFLWTSNPCAACSTGLPKRSICKPCSNLSRKDLMRRLKQRHKRAMARRKSVSEEIHCTDCKQKLTSEWPRFWCCGGCKKVCPYEIHPVWAAQGLRPPPEIEEEEVWFSVRDLKGKKEKEKERGEMIGFRGERQDTHGDATTCTNGLWKKQEALGAKYNKEYFM